jgi:hypothetical protein
LAYASILGLFEETGIGNGDYNNLNTIFYAGEGYHYVVQSLYKECSAEVKSVVVQVTL